jgi:hypothetical protein
MKTRFRSSRKESTFIYCSERVLPRARVQHVCLHETERLSVQLCRVGYVSAETKEEIYPEWRRAWWESFHAVHDINLRLCLLFVIDSMRYERDVVWGSLFSCLCAYEDVIYY